MIIPLGQNHRPGDFIVGVNPSNGQIIDHGIVISLVNVDKETCDKTVLWHRHRMMSYEGNWSYRVI